MRQYLTANDIANTVRMTRSLHHGNILLDLILGISLKRYKVALDITYGELAKNS